MWLFFINHLYNILCANIYERISNTLKNNNNVTPDNINSTKSFFPTIGGDNEQTKVDFNKVAQSYNVTYSPRVFSGFKDKLNELKEDTKTYAVLAFVKYWPDSNAGHYVGVNDLKNINGTDYLEIAPTSTNDTNQESRRSTWVFQDGKIYVPYSDIKNIDILTQ